jgi:hypothetical protein
MKTLLLAAALACPTPEVVLQKGMPEELKALAAQTDFSKFFPQATAVCQDNGFECLTGLYVLSSGDIDIACGNKGEE